MSKFDKKNVLCQIILLLCTIYNSLSLCLSVCPSGKHTYLLWAAYKMHLKSISRFLFSQLTFILAKNVCDCKSNELNKLLAGPVDLLSISNDAISFFF